MWDAVGDEDEIALRSVDALASGEDGQLAADDIEGLVLVMMRVQRRRAAKRVVDLDLREAPAGLGAARLHAHASGLPPDVALRA